MLHIDKWAADKPKFLAILAHTFATLSEDICVLVNTACNGNYSYKEIPVIPIKEWMSLYTDHRRIWGWLKNSFQEFLLPMVLMRR